MNARIAAELAHIGRGGLSQGVFRSAYNIRRRYELARDPSTHPRLAIEAAVEDTRRGDPEFVPIYDRAFFD